MKVSMVTGPGKAEVVDADRPQAGPNDAVVQMRACGICGSDAFYITIGGIPPRQGHTPLGHEPAGEVVEVGANVSGIAVGDHVVINPMAAPGGIIGNGGAAGALADYLLIENAVRGTSLEVIPKHIPWEVAALNEPMAVARHGANQCKPKSSDKVAIFGAGPIGLGATLAFKSLGVSHVVVIDLIASRLDKALRIGADAVINSAEEDVVKRLVELHGEGESIFPGKAGTDIYFDAAGVPAVVNTALAAAQEGRHAGNRRRAQGAGSGRVRQRDEQRDHHRRIHGIPRRNLRGDWRSRRELGEVRARSSATPSRSTTSARHSTSPARRAPPTRSWSPSKGEQMQHPTRRACGCFCVCSRYLARCASASWAALAPHMPCAPGPGGVAAEQMYMPGTPMV